MVIYMTMEEFKSGVWIKFNAPLIYIVKEVMEKIIFL